jgi:hypothetical protein
LGACGPTGFTWMLCCLKTFSNNGDWMKQQAIAFLAHVNAGEGSRRYEHSSCGSDLSTIASGRTYSTPLASKNAPAKWNEHEELCRVSQKVAKVGILHFSFHLTVRSMPKFKIDGVWYDAPSYAAARKMSKEALPAATSANPKATAPLTQPSATYQKKSYASPKKPKAASEPPSAVKHVSKPVVFATNTTVAATAMTVSTKAAAATPSGKIRVVHRADGRSLSHKSIVRDRGFGCQNGMWQIRERKCARTFIQKLLNPSMNASAVQGFEFAAEVLTPVARNTGAAGGGTMTQITLSDVAATIKRVLKDTRAFWISTSVNAACGGYATRGDYNVYRFTLPVALNQYELELGEKVNTLKPVTARSSDTVPTICFDGPADGSDATIVALNIGPLDDCEISFLTHIPLSWVEVIKVATT